MESKNFDQDCVRLSENFETFENVCANIKQKHAQQNQVQSNNFTHILKNSTKSIEVENLFTNTNTNTNTNKKQKDKNENNLENHNKIPNIELKKFETIKALEQRDFFHKPTNFLIIGKRSTGKSYVVKEICLLLKNKNIVKNRNFLIEEITCLSNPNKIQCCCNCIKIDLSECRF